MENQSFPELLSFYYLNQQNTPDFTVSYGVRISQYWELELILEGTGHIFTKNQKIPTVPGRLFIRPPGIQLEGFTPYHSYYILFSDAQNRLSGLPDYFDGMEFTIPYFQDIRRAVQKETETGNLAAHAACCRLISEVMQHSQNMLPEAVAASIRRIQEHFSEELTVSELAEASGYSLNHYTRLFRQCTGQTPMHYILSCRIRHACLLLEETSDTTEAIAQTCGFRNFSYFFRAFKQLRHLTPGEYRRNKRSYLSGQSSPKAGDGFSTK